MSFIETVSSASSFLSALNQNMPSFVDGVGNLVNALSDISRPEIQSPSETLISNLSPSVLEERTHQENASKLPKMLSDISEKPEEEKEEGTDIGAILPKSGLSSLQSLFESMASGKTAKSALAMEGGVKGMVAGAAKMIAIQGAMAFISGMVAPFSSIMGSVTALGTTLGTGFQPMVNDINKTIISAMPYLMQAADWMRDMYDTSKNWVSTLTWDSVKTFFTEFPANAMTWILEKRQVLFDWFGQLPGLFRTWLLDNQDEIKQWFKDFPKNAVDWLISNAPKLWDWFFGLPLQIVGWIGETIGILGEFVGGWPGEIVQWIGNSIHVVADWFKDLPENIVAWVTSTWYNVTTFFTNLPGQIKTTIENGFSVVTAWFASLPSLILNAITGSAMNFRDKITEWWDDLWD